MNLVKKDLLTLSDFTVFRLKSHESLLKSNKV